MMKEIDKSKLVLVHNKVDRIQDQPLETVEIGYYKDSWNRFKKNKASLTAFIIILIIMFFVIFGPYMKKYDLPEKKPNVAQKLAYLPPKIPVLEKLGIFDGTKTIEVPKKFVLYLNSSEEGKGIVKSGIPKELIENPDHPDYANVFKLSV